MMMGFAVKNLGIHIFRAKIGESNEGSLSLFKKLVGLFVQKIANLLKV